MVRAVARIDHDAVERNCARLKAELREGAELCAVVKADGYGHGADGCATAALAGGATRLAVATGAEAAQGGRRFPQVPLLSMGALSPDELGATLLHDSPTDEHVHEVGRDVVEDPLVVRDDQGAHVRANEVVHAGRDD